MLLFAFVFVIYGFALCVYACLCDIFFFYHTYCCISIDLCLFVAFFYSIVVCIVAFLYSLCEETCPLSCFKQTFPRFCVCMYCCTFCICLFTFCLFVCVLLHFTLFVIVCTVVFLHLFIYIFLCVWKDCLVFLVKCFPLPQNVTECVCSCSCLSRVPSFVILHLLRVWKPVMSFVVFLGKCIPLPS